MELNPSNEPSSEQTESDEKKDTKKSKKKDAEKLGAMVVEAKSEDKSKKTAGLWEELLADQKTEKDTKPERSPNDKTPELDAEAPLEHLSEVERQAAVQDLAIDRRAALAAELAGADSDISLAHQAEMADAFLAKAEASGDPEAAYAETMQELDSEPDVIEGVIDTTRADEGEVPLQSEATIEDAPDVATPPPAAPPRVPGGTGSATPPAGGSGGGMPIPVPGGGFNAAPTQPASPNTLSAEDAAYYEAQALSRGVVTGGIVGYLIGRRRGRIKTEKRLLPVQRKLEHEVKDLQFALAEKEIAIRKAAAQNRRVGLSQASEQYVRTITEQQRQHAVEKDQARPASLPSERIGHVLVTAESGRTTSESRIKKPAAAETRAIEKQVATMSRAELLTMSEKVAVEGTTLRQIYETHLVGERGLRRLVAEHLRGGNVQQTLKRELVERQIDFERDPILRDRARASLAGGGKAALNSLVQQAGAVAVLPAKNKPDDNKAAVAKPKATHREKHSLAADVALGSTILVLIIFIIMLLTRG